nr:MAG TPA: hypothetical protein [Caudoviricetes sp.]
MSNTNTFFFTYCFNPIVNQQLISSFLLEKILPYILT